MKLSRRILPLLPLLACVACGSTVPHEQLVQATGAQDGLEAPTAATTGPTQDSLGASIAATDGPRSQLGSTGVPQPSNTGLASTSNLGAGAGPSTIKVGIPYEDSSQMNAFLQAGGAKSLERIDDVVVYKTLIARINGLGGVGGRQVEPVFLKLNGGDEQSTRDQEACSFFTQDHRVPVVIDAAGLGEDFLTCAAKARIGVVSSAPSDFESASYRRFPGFYQPAAVALDSNARLQATQFLALGFFGDLKTTRVGILYYSRPDFARAEKVLETLLKQEGVNVAATAEADYVGSTADVPRLSSQGSSAILRFRSAGVTHVLALEDNAWLAGGFGLEANGQNYFPRYGYTSAEPLGNVAANVPERELKGAMFLGWQPSTDVADASYLRPEATRCLTYAKSRGLSTSTSNERQQVVVACEQLSFLNAALGRAPVISGAQSLSNGAATLQDYRSAATFAVSFASGRHDGATTYRPGVWDQGCACFKYTGAPRTFRS